MTIYSLPYMAKINISPIYWTEMLSYIEVLKKFHFSTVSKTPRALPGPQKRPYLIFTNLPRMCEKKIK